MQGKNTKISSEHSNLLAKSQLLLFFFLVYNLQSFSDRCQNSTIISGEINALLCNFWCNYYSCFRIKSGAIACALLNIRKESVFRKHIFSFGLNDTTVSDLTLHSPIYPGPHVKYLTRLSQSSLSTSVHHEKRRQASEKIPQFWRGHLLLAQFLSVVCGF